MSNRNAIIYCLIYFGLFSGLQKAHTQDVIADSAGIILGAIRWDWTGGGTVNEWVEKALGPEKWHYRVPFFGEIVNDSTIKASCSSQECVDREILYAKENGLDYWAFLIYPAGGDLDLPLRRYLSSGYNSVLNFCAIGADDVDRIIGYFKHPSYQRVLDGKPLYYIHKFDTGDDHLDLLRAACVAEGIPEPYVVVMEDQQQPAYDGITRYWYNGTNFDGSITGAPYSVLSGAASNFWVQKRDQGYQQVPLVSAGTDGRPRIECTPPWISDPSFYEKYYDAPTPGELASSVQDAVNFVAANPASCEAKAILIYSWNENDEGGWLTPTLDTVDPSLIDDSRLRAIKEVVWPTDPSNPGAADASLLTMLIDGDTLESFNPDILNYLFELPRGTSKTPVITAISTQQYARIRLLQPSGADGEAIIEVRSEDGSVQRDYSILFSVDHRPLDSIGWEFNTPGNLEGWETVWSGHAGIAVPESTLTVTVLGDYPQVKSSAGLNINALTYDRMIIGLMNNSTSDEFYWRFYDIDRNETTQGFVPTISDTEFQEYEFDLKSIEGWEGTIDELHWMPARKVGTGTVEFDYIRFYLTEDALSDEASLSSILVDDEPLEGFNPDQTSYMVELPEETGMPPMVDAVVSHPGASLSIQQAVDVDGTARVDVVSQSGLFTKSYSIDFELDELVRVPYYYTNFQDGALPPGWKALTGSYQAEIVDQAFTLDIKKNVAPDAYTLAELFVEDFYLRPYMTLQYQAEDSLELGIRIIGPSASISNEEVFQLPSTVDWTTTTLNLSALATESWGYDLDSIQLVFQPEQSSYAGNFELNEIMIGDSLSDKVFTLSVEQAPPLLVDLGRDTTIVPSATLLLDAGNPGASFLWSTGETTPSIVVDTVGTYWVRVIGANNCTRSDTIKIDLASGEDKGLSPQIFDSKIYPNPNQGTFMLEINNPEEENDLEIFILDVTGKIVFHRFERHVLPATSIEISMDGVSTGLYYLKLLSEKKTGVMTIAIH